MHRFMYKISLYSPKEKLQDGTQKYQTLLKSENAKVFDIPIDGIIPECRQHRSWRLPLNENDQKYIAVQLDQVKDSSLSVERFWS